MALMGSKSFSGTGSKSRHKIKHSTTLPRTPKAHKTKSAAANSRSDSTDGAKIDHIGEISVSEYRSVMTDPSDNHKRRAIMVQKMEDGSLGFTLQPDPFTNNGGVAILAFVHTKKKNNNKTYGLYHAVSGELEVWTYVDYVAHDGPAKKAGMRPGDVIISINGESTETADHRTIVDLIRSAPDKIRIVVLFQDCVRKVQLHQRLLKLKQLLEVKERQLKDLDDQETRIIEGHDISLSSDSSLEDQPAPQSVTGLRRTKLTGSLPLLPSVYQPKLSKSASMSNTENALNATAPPSRERHASESARGGLGSEIKLLDPATIARVGCCPSPQTMRRYPASPSFNTRKGLRRNDALKKGVSPRLGAKTRADSYISDRNSGEIVIPSDSDDDEAFVSFSPETTPPQSPSKQKSLTFGPGDRVRPPSPLVGGKEVVMREKMTLGVPKMLTVLSPMRSKTPEPRLVSPHSPVKATRPHSPLVLEKVPSEHIREMGRTDFTSDVKQPIKRSSLDDVTKSQPMKTVNEDEEITNL